MKRVLLLTVASLVGLTLAIALVVFLARERPYLVLVVAASAVWPLIETANYSIHRGGRRGYDRSYQSPRHDQWM
jgi:hypothetical protein